MGIDVTVIKDGIHGDTSKMFIVGKPTIQGEHVVRMAHECLMMRIEQVKPGVHLGTIGHAIAKKSSKDWLVGLMINQL